MEQDTPGKAVEIMVKKDTQANNHNNAQQAAKGTIGLMLVLTNPTVHASYEMINIFTKLVIDISILLYPQFIRRNGKLMNKKQFQKYKNKYV